LRDRKLRAGLIRAKLTLIEESIELVNEHLPENFNEFSCLGLIKDGIYKRTEFAIENVIDICAIINSDLGLEMPDSDESIVVSLARAGILTDDMADKIKRMRGFRNIVLHRYGEIDDRDYMWSPEIYKEESGIAKYNCIAKKTCLINHIAEVGFRDLNN